MIHYSFGLVTGFFACIPLVRHVQGQPTNQVCSEPEGLPFSLATPGTTVDATLTDEVCLNPEEDVFLSQNAWYNFTFNGHWLTLFMCPDENNTLSEWDVRAQNSCADSECARLPDTIGGVDGGLDIFFEDAPVFTGDFPICNTSTPIIKTMVPLPDGIPFLASVLTKNEPGSFVLTLVNHFPPNYAQCENAIAVTVDAEPISMSFANTIDDRVDGCVPAARHLWFRFVGTGNQLAIRACSIDFEASNPQVRIQSECNATQCICDSSGQGCDREFLNSTECPKGHQQLVFTEVGETYYAYAGRDLLRTDLLVDISVSTHAIVNTTDSPTVAPVTSTPTLTIAPVPSGGNASFSPTEPGENDGEIDGETDPPSESPESDGEIDGETDPPSESPESDGEIEGETDPPSESPESDGEIDGETVPPTFRPTETMEPTETSAPASTDNPEPSEEPTEFLGSTEIPEPTESPADSTPTPTSKPTVQESKAMVVGTMTPWMSLVITFMGASFALCFF